MPSTAADIIPPAYPAPSPHGYNPFIFDCLFSFLVICTGDELLVSTPVNIASGCANPFIDLSKYFIPSIRVFDIKSGNISFKFESVTPGLYVDFISPICVDFTLFSKSSNLCIGAL